MKKLFLIAVFCLCSSPVFSGTVKIVIVGDSNMEYTSSPYGDFGSKLSTALHAAYPSTTYTVYNLAVGATTSANCSGTGGAGNPTADCISNASGYTPDIIAWVHAGTNDGHYGYITSFPAVYEDGSADPTVPRYEARMRAYKAQADALSSSQYNGHPLMLIIGAPAHAENGDGFAYYRNATQVGPVRTKAYQLALEWNAPYVDWPERMSTASASWKADYLVDGVHVNSAAKDLLASATVQILKQWLDSSGLVIVPQKFGGEQRIGNLGNDGRLSF